MTESNVLVLSADRYHHRLLLMLFSHTLFGSYDSESFQNARDHLDIQFGRHGLLISCYLY